MYGEDWLCKICREENDMLLKTAICEDNPTQAKNMRRLLSLWSRERGQAAVIQDYDSCEAFLWDWNQKMDFHLLLLDIDLGGEINGMELARRIREKDDEVVIIFVTGLPEYMSQGYDVKACHFLVKPVEEGKLLTVLGGGQGAEGACKEGGVSASGGGSGSLEDSCQPYSVRGSFFPYRRAVSGA